MQLQGNSVPALGPSDRPSLAVSMNRGRPDHWSMWHDASCDTIKIGEASCHCTLPKGFLILVLGALGGKERLCRWYVCVEVCAMWECEQWW